jgi:hypothetical protein
MQWFVTGDEAHARKAIEILDAWSGTLADFFENDAMLLAGWTGGQFCNAAEILRATYPKWAAPSQAQFKRMLLTVYVPLLRIFYPEANGNWDAAIMWTLLSIGIPAFPFRPGQRRHHALRIPERPMRRVMQRPGAYATRPQLLREYMRSGLEPGSRSLR